MKLAGIESESIWLKGGGEMGMLMRSHDWSTSSFGPPANWPQSLRTAVRLLLNTGQPMYIFWGADGACLYNDAYRQSIGPERHPSSIGRPARQVWGEIWEVIGPQIDLVMSGQGSTWHENQLVPITRNGIRENVYWTYSYSPIDDDAAPTGVGGVLVLCAETTAQILAIESLALNDKRLQLALSAGPGIGTWDWDAQTGVIVADARFASLYGIDPEKVGVGIVAQDFLSRLYTGDLERVREIVDRAIQSGEDFEAEYRVLSAEGDQRWVVARGRRQINPDGNTYWRGVSFDISNRKAHEQEILELNRTLEKRVVERTDQLKANESRLRSVLESSNQYQGLMSVDGTLLYANATALRDIEAAQEDVFGLPYWTTPWFAETPGMPETIRGAVSQVAQGGEVRQELRLALPKGWRWFDFSIRPIRDEAGAVTAILPEAIDITERRNAEEALRQSQKMEAVGQLTGGLAHDFNNLLMGISGSLEMLHQRLKQGRLDDLERHVNAAQVSVSRAAALTHRLLAFSRRQTLAPKPTGVNRLILNMEELVRRTVGPSIQVHVAGGVGLWLAMVDPNQLESALLNLCINARDAMPDGGHLTIETQNEWLDQKTAAELEIPAGAYLTLSVSDSGSGMPTDVISRAFDPFFTTKPLGKGTGLGLSMVYGFSRQSGGQVRIYSELNLGTTVCLYIPRYFGVESKLDTDMPSVNSERPVSLKKESVLVVDDEATIRTLIAEVLQDLDYIPLEAEDAQSGLSILQSDVQINLLITDVGLPGGINGRQLADAGRALRPDLKVLFITGFSETSVIRSGHLDPGMDVLTKPFSLDTLTTRIQKMVTVDSRD